MTQAFLKHLKVKNFKSFSDLDIELRNFNVIIGANASGKSNFVQIFNFLKDIKEHGLDNALSLQGGIEYTRNFKEKVTKNLSIELEITLPKLSPMRTPYLGLVQHRLFYNSATWKFELEMRKRSGFKIITDVWNFNIEAFKRDGFKQQQKISEGTIEVTRKNGHLQLNGNFPNNEITTKDLRHYTFQEDIPSKSLLIQTYLGIEHLFPDISEFFENIIVYDFDPKLAKRTAVPLKGRVELENNGSNLAIILRSIIENKESYRKFSNLMTDILPFVKSIDTEGFPDKSILFTLTDTHFKDSSLPSSLISDGTINITSLIVALYFQQQHSLEIFEEPEKNIHPSLISKVISMMNEISQTRQILVITHNPEIVRYAGLENLFAVKRNKAGFSEIIRLLDVEEINIFLENEMEIEELYIQNILSG